MLLPLPLPPLLPLLLFRSITAEPTATGCDSDVYSRDVSQRPVVASTRRQRRAPLSVPPFRSQKRLNRESSAASPPFHLPPWPASIIWSILPSFPGMLRTDCVEPHFNRDDGSQENRSSSNKNQSKSPENSHGGNPSTDADGM